MLAARLILTNFTRKLAILPRTEHKTLILYDALMDQGGSCFAVWWLLPTNLSGRRWGFNVPTICSPVLVAEMISDAAAAQSCILLQSPGFPAAFAG